MRYFQQVCTDVALCLCYTKQEKRRFVTRTMYPTMPPGVEYMLKPLAQTLHETAVKKGSAHDSLASSHRGDRLHRATGRQGGGPSRRSGPTPAPTREGSGTCPTASWCGGRAGLL